MTELIQIIIAAAFVNNFVLVQFLGLCPFLGTSGHSDSATGMAMATALVLTVSSMVSYLVDVWLLQPFGLDYLRTVLFIVLIAVAVQLTELIIRKSSPLLHQTLGIFLPLITTNCAVLGVALLNQRQSHSLIESAAYGFGAAAGFGLVLILFSSIRERLKLADIPASFQGAAIAMITAGLMALAFMGFSGLGNL